jgi:catechol 2,3-dioxygenase-like lactoylglutathione lyase family enzyme
MQTNINMRLAHARIVTKDVPALARFYEEITGIVPAGVDDYKEFQTPGGAFAISSQGKMDLHGAGAAISGANRSMVLDFEVADVDAERGRLSAIVGRFVLEPTDQPWGSRSMMFRDPDGNLVNFFTRVVEENLIAIPR